MNQCRLVKHYLPYSADTTTLARVIYFLPVMFFFSFLLVQKRNKKRPPKTKQPVFGKGFSI
jgi:hypothetical protein